MIKIWRTLDTKIIAKTKLFTLKTRRTIVEGKSPTEVCVLDAPDWVNIVAVTPHNTVILIKQYRHGTGRVTLEIPGGTVDPGETPLEAAQRELREETGYQAEEWSQLGRVCPNPAFLNNSCYTFLASPARRVQPQELDAGEVIDVVETPFAEIPALLIDGHIDHALVVAGFHWYWLRHSRTE